MIEKSASAVEIITVGMAELKASKAPHILRTILGSCIGVALYDAENKVGGLLHIMLPYMTPGATNRAKFADTGIVDLIQAVLKQGAKRENLYVRMAGGARMFGNIKAAVQDIGAKNEEAALEILKREGIRVRLKDTGGDRGRKMTFDLGTGKIIVSSFGGTDREM